MSSKLKRRFYLLRREINRECAYYKELQNKLDPTLEEISALAETKLKLKTKLKSIEELIKAHIVDPEISLILSLKLHVCTTIQASKITHILHQKARKISKLNFESKSKTQNDKSKHPSSIIKPPKPTLNESIKKYKPISRQQKVESKSSTKSTEKTKKQKEQNNLLSSKKQHTQPNESTVITIKISKEDYYQLIQNKESFQLSRSESNLLFDD